jgi:hypothetical protein
MDTATPQTWRNALKGLEPRNLYIAIRTEDDKNVLYAARKASSIAGRTTFLGKNKGKS